MPSAIFAGSFDPPTLGHVDIVRRGAALYDRVVVAIGVNPAKKGLFSPEERVRLFDAALAELDNVQLITFSGLLVHAAEEEGCEVILRGLRSAGDLELETRNAQANRELSGVETLFLLTDPTLAHVSSSLVREIARFGGSVERYVTPEVNAALVDRMASA